MTSDDIAQMLGTATGKQLEALFASQGASTFLEIETADDEYVFELFSLNDVMRSDEIDAIGDGIAIGRDAGDWLLCLSPGPVVSAFILNPDSSTKVAIFGSIEELASSAKWV